MEFFFLSSQFFFSTVGQGITQVSITLLGPARQKNTCVCVHVCASLPQAHVVGMGDQCGFMGNVWCPTGQIRLQIATIRE